MHRHRFHAMGTEIELLLEADRPGRAFAAVEAEFERLEQACSRFRPDSELSQLNRAGRLDAGPDLVRVVRAALEARERTGGLFDPTVSNALVEAGYDRSFDLLAQDGAAAGTSPRPCGGAVAVREGRIELGPGVALDLGGIAKGDAVDRAADLLGGSGPCLVNAGGDLAVRGVPAAGSWPVAVEVPAGELVVGVSSGALATSGRDRRRWRRGGEERHHLIDPRTGASAAGDVLRATVAGPTAVAAEADAKALFLGADPEGHDAILVHLDGRVTRTGALA
jgi:FAD:protein FMN transferase